MQAMPSTTPLSRTAFRTSSVMSVTVRPPAVRRRVSCWNTFIAAAILRESLPDAAVEPSHPQRILQDATRRVPRPTWRARHLREWQPALNVSSSRICRRSRWCAPPLHRELPWVVSGSERAPERRISAEAVETLVWLAESKGVERRRYTIVNRLRAVRDSDHFATLPEDLRARVREIVAEGR